MKKVKIAHITSGPPVLDISSEHLLVIIYILF